jgi:hypothetical protein
MPPDNWYMPRDVVLLTGAGFSKPYGGLLGSEMWSLILNQPQISQSQKLHTCLLENLNYEAVYDAVLTPGIYSEEEQKNFTDALRNAYLQLDDAIRTDDRNRLGLASMMCQYFVGRFSGSGRKRGFVFTLNQDLLVERFYSQDRGVIQIPSLGHPKWFNGRLRTPLESEDWITIPEENHINKYKANFWSKDSGIEHFVYLKLHGSYGWQYGDGKNALVIGLTKSERIAKEMLLSWYYDLFKHVILAARVLVVVGYGFMDEHINEVIANAISNGLRLHIINPKPPSEFNDLLVPMHGFVSKPVPRGKEIWNGIYGYHCASLPDLVQNGLTPKGDAVLMQIGV